MTRVLPFRAVVYVPASIYQGTLVGASGLAIIIAATKMFGLVWTLPLILYGIVITICGTVIYLSVNLFTASTAFCMQGGRTSVMFMVQRLRDFANYPITIFAAPIRILLTWIIPFSFAGFYPATRILGRDEFSAYVYLLPVVTIAFFFLSYSLWRLGLSRYQSTGS